jgi:hypothetical protein
LHKNRENMKKMWKNHTKKTENMLGFVDMKYVREYNEAVL